jgi:hypothetical protein
MRGLVLSLSHLSPILLVSLLVLSTHLLWAQRKSPLEEIPVQLLDTPAQLAIVSEALHFTDRGLPLSFPQNQGQTESWKKFFPAYNTGGYRSPTNAVLDRVTRMAGLRSEEKYFTGSTPSKWLTFVPTYGNVHVETIYRVDELEYYGHQIPWAGSLMLRICQQAKVHPHVTRVLKVLRPRF